MSIHLQAAWHQRIEDASGVPCRVCGRLLRSAASIAAGVGPVCAGEAHKAVNRDDYGMDHAPTETGPALHEIGDHYPDIYDHPEYYGSMGERHSRESARALQATRGKGPEHPVTIYRSAPRGITGFNKGDWVALSPNYAKLCGTHRTDETKDMPVYKSTVAAKHVRWAEDDLNEFGYHGPPVAATQHTPGGSNAERVRPKLAGRQQDGDERPFGSYDMHYHSEDQGERKPRHVITTHIGDTKVGEMNWYGTTGTIHHIDVEPEHGRRGIATAMWNWAQEMSPKPKHSGDRTTMGDQWARSVGGPRPRKNQ